MTTLRLEFPAGCYHATPYGRHVNEGVAEWPPSPYRLMRGLYDVWKRKCPDLSEAAVESVLSALSQNPPRFHLPLATATHTRSYLSANTFDPSDKNLVFDAFLAFEKNTCCYVSWPDVELSTDQHATLEELLRHVNYLGRSESWIRITLDHAVSGISCDPLEVAQDYDGEPVSVACVASPALYKGKRGWMDALTTSTAEVTKQRVSSPPLLRSVPYLRPLGCIETDPVRRFSPRKGEVEAVLLVLDSTVLPLVTETLPVAEQIRTRLMGAHRKKMNGDPSRVSALFSGKDATGQKRLDHGHLYILPLSEKGHRINSVMLVNPRGSWMREELDAAQFVRSLWQSDGRPDVHCAVAWQGSRGKLASVWSSSREVESVTPFVPPRHWRRGRDFQHFLEDEVRRECQNHGLPPPLTIKFEDKIRGSMFECVEYRRNRKDDPARPGYSIRLTFNEPVTAPFTIGYGAHFGLGMFRRSAG